MREAMLHYGQVKKMKKIYFLVCIFLLLHSRCTAQTMAITDLEKVNQALIEKQILWVELLDPINIKCQTQLKAVNRNLTKSEYVAILHEILWEKLPEEVKQLESLSQSLNELALLLEDDSLVQQMEETADWTMPLPDTYSSYWVDLRMFATGKTYSQTALEVLKQKNILDQGAYDRLKLKLESNAILFPHQIFELVLKEIKG